MAEEEPELSAAPPRATSVKINPSDIKNKAKRQEVAIKLREEKAKLRKDARRKRQRQREELGEDAPPKRVRARSRRGQRGEYREGCARDHRRGAATCVAPDPAHPRERARGGGNHGPEGR